MDPIPLTLSEVRGLQPMLPVPNIMQSTSVAISSSAWITPVPMVLIFRWLHVPLATIVPLPVDRLISAVVAVMLLTGKTFNFVAIVGTLGLMGMLIKNGIVLMDEITLQLSQGVEPMKALIDSAQSRLRPVMMASLTTILGMIPLLTDAMFGSLAASIMGGLLFSSVITLVFLPILYALFFKIKNK